MTNDEIRASAYRLAQALIAQADKKPTTVEQGLIKDAVDLGVNFLQNINDLAKKP
jgi:hypothetical protein